MTRSHGVRILAVLGALAVANCFRDSTGVKFRHGTFGFSPQFSVAGAAQVVDFDKVRIRLYLPGTTTLALDTTVSFPSNADSIKVPLQVQLQSGATSQDFDLTLAYVNAAGDTVFRGGPTRVTATVSPSGNQAPPVPVIYVGVGSTAAGVRWVTTPATAFFGDTAVFAAQAYDSSGTAIPGVPIVYSVNPLDTLLARVPDPAVGKVVAKSVRGPARVVATLLTGQSVTASLLVQPKPGNLAIVSGNNILGIAGTVLPQPQVVRVTGSDGLGIAGATVTFAVTAGGGTLSSTTALTDTGGRASVTWTMGPTAGTNTMTASVAGLTPVTFTATAQPGTPAIHLIFPGNALNLDVTAALGLKLSQPAPSGGLTVTVTSDSIQYVTVATPGTVAFAAGDTLRTINVTGVAYGVSLLHARATGYTADSIYIGVVPNILVLGQNVAVAVGQTANISIQLIPAAPTGGLTITFASSDTTRVRMTTPTVTIPAGQTTGSATVQGVAAGVVGVTATAPGYATGATVVTAGVAGQPALLTKVAGDLQTAAVGTAVTIPPAVRVTDIVGAAVPGATVTFAVASGGGSVTGASAVTNSSGVATVGSWTVGTTAGANTLVASLGTLTPVVFTATGSASAIASTTVTPHLDTVTAINGTFQLTAQAKDASGNNVTGNFTWVSRTSASVSVNATGLVTGLVNATSSWVVATEASGTRDSALIVVYQKVASVLVTPSAKNIYLTGHFQFTAKAVDGLGTQVPGVTSFTWATTAPAVATVDTTGYVVGIGLGSAQIRATTGTITGVASVSIITPITRIAVVVDTVGAAKTDTFSMPSLGLRRRYRAIAHDTLDAVMSGLTFTWASTNGSVAVMNSTTGDTASVTSAANGITNINATAQGFTSAPGALLTVSQVLASIQLSPPTTNPSAIIGVGGRIGLVARGLDANSRYIAGGSFGYSSANTGVATVDATGVVTGVTNGTANITASSGAITSNALAVTVSPTPPAIISFGRDTVSVGRGSSGSIPVLLSSPVPVGATLTVNLTTTPNAYAHWSTSSVSIASGATSANATLVGDSAGTTTVTATDGSGLGYATGTAIAKVTANMRLTSGSYAINATDIATTQVLLSDPSPAGGTYVTFVYGTPGIAQVSPDPAFIPAGQLAADIQIRGLAGGTTTITPNAIGVNGTASSFTAYAPVLRFYYTSLLLGLGQYYANDWLYAPTYTNTAIPVTLASSDTTVITVTPAVDTIPSGSSYAYFTATARRLGTATITATAPGWTASNAVTVTSSTPHVGICCGGTIYTTSGIQTLGVYAEDSLKYSHPRTNSLIVSLSSSDTTVIKVVDTVVTINAGASYASPRVTPGALGGTAYVKVTASGHTPDSVLYTVNGPPLSFYYTNNYLGVGQRETNNWVQVPNSVASALIVTLTNSDSTKASTATTVTIPTGSNYAYVTARAYATGVDTVTASAPGYQAGRARYTVTTPTLTACCSNSALNNFSGPQTISVYSADSLRGTHGRMTPLSVSVVSTDTTILRVDSATVTIDSGTYYNNRAHVTPVGLGTARIVFTAAGHVTLDTLTYTVVAPKLNAYYGSVTVGRRQHYGTTSDWVYTPNNRPVAVPLTVTYLHGNVDSLGPSTLTIPANNNYVYFDVFGLATGRDTVIFSAAGYSPDTLYVTVTTPRFTTYGMPSSTTTTNPPFGIYVYAADSLGTAHYSMDTVVVRDSSSDSTVIQPIRPYRRIPANSSYALDTINVVGPGTANITYRDSAGTGYLPVTTANVTVTGPALTLYNNAPVLGMRQTSWPTGTYVYTPNAVATPLVVNLLSTGTRVATVPASVTIPANSNSAYFIVTAMDTIGTIQIQATATGYGSATMNVQVTQPRLAVSTATQLNTTSPRTPIYVYAADANGNDHPTTEAVVVTLQSSAPAVAAIDSPTVTIPAGQYYVNTPMWSPGVIGTSQFTASDGRSAYYAYTPGTDNVTVVTPRVGLASVPGYLGIGQYNDYAYAYTPDNMTAPTTVTLTHAGTVRTGTYTNLTNTPITQVTIPASSNSSYFRIAGLVAGTDSLVASIASPVHNPDTVYTVVGLGRVDPISGWPSSIRVGDSVQVTLYARDPSQGTGHLLVAATQFNFTNVSNIQFWSGGANSVQITSVTVPADAQYVTFYVKGLTAGTGSVTITATNYQSYTNTVTVQ